MFQKIHASRCAEEKFNIQVLRYEPDVDIDETKAYEENMENDVVKPDKEVGVLINLLALEKCGIRRNLKIRRNEAWSDHCSYLCKPWLKGCLCDYVYWRDRLRFSRTKERILFM